jgi:shikimate kinase
MGTGKTTAAKEVARMENIKFVDLDDLIEEKEKRSILEIFASDGEAYFRRIEKEILQNVSTEDNLIVACGGGIVLDPENIALMKKTGKIVCLTAEPDVILARTSRQNFRPLLKAENPREKIDFLLNQRAACYARSDHTIDTSHISPQKAAEEIINFAFPRGHKGNSVKEAGMAKAKIFIVDDEEEICFITKQILEKTGKFGADYTTESINAVDLIKEYKPDLILLDVCMPVIDGTDVADLLSKEPETGSIPVVFLTALAQKEEVNKQSGKIGGRFFIAKPVSPDELIQRIESILTP